MADDLVLRVNPQYRHLFEDKPQEAKPEVLWMKPQNGVVSSKCGKYQVRKHGDPTQYDLYNVRIAPFSRMIKDGFTSFDAVKEYLRNGDES